MGFALDQQVTVQKAFSGPLELRHRLGYLHPRRIAATDPAQLDRVFRERPALHRFPGAMAKRVQALAQAITEQYGGDASASGAMRGTGRSCRLACWHCRRLAR